MPTRRIMATGLTAATAGLLSGCGTIIYPERINQKERGDLDFVVVGMDAVGLLFFLVPGIVAFVVDFGTGAIYYPAEREEGERETTIFDKMKAEAKLDQAEIERLVEQKTGERIDLGQEDIRVMRLQRIEQFTQVRRTLSSSTRLAAR